MAFALFLFINSCKKENDNKEKIDPARKKEILSYINGPKIEIINFAQFKSKANINALGSLKKEFEIVPSSKAKKMAINTAETYLGFTILTDSIKVIKDKGHTMYVFPVVLPSKRAISFQNLTIDESDSGTVAFVNTYTPTKKWIAEWKKGHPGKFDGIINITYLNLNTVKQQYGDGAKNLPTGINTAQTINKPAIAVVCTTTTYYHEVPYSCASGNHYPEDLCYLTGDDRAGYNYFSYNITVCENENPGGGGGTTPTPPPAYDPCPEDPPLISSKKSLRNKIMIVPPTECDEEEPLPQVPPTNVPIKEINNNITDSCLKTTITDAISTNKDVKGFLSDLITNYAGLNNGIKINISNGNIPKPAQTTASFTSNTFIADIVFQNGYYNDVSKEAVVAALIHEVVHAYLLQTSSTYRNQPKEEQHNFLYTNFVHDIATYLINKYSMPSDNAYGLAWSGMGELYIAAGPNDTFKTTPAIPATGTTPATHAKTMTKTEIGGAVAPYNFVGTGSMGIPNCP